MTARRQISPETPAGLALFAKLVVAATLGLIFIGGLVTSWQAGMAVPDWPLSFGSINPDGWWANFPVRLEHGHRLFAMLLGLLIGVLCAWTWGNWRPLLAAAIVSALLPEIFRAFGAPKAVLMHLRIWPAAVAFLTMLLWRSGEKVFARPAGVRWLAAAAFICVCIQATLGGLRVTRETAGAVDVALILRITHACVAQAFLCLVVAIAALLASHPMRNEEGLPRLRRLAWLTVGAIYLQLIFGAAMRHLGAGLAIPTFPHATAAGSYLPATHNAYVDLNFAHTRLGAIGVTLLILTLVVLVLRSARGELRLTRPAWLLATLVVVQMLLGMFVIWHLKPRTLTTFHVVNGAALLATSVLLAMRACSFSQTSSRPAMSREIAGVFP